MHVTSTPAEKLLAYKADAAAWCWCFAYKNFFDSDYSETVSLSSRPETSMILPFHVVRILRSSVCTIVLHVAYISDKLTGLFVSVLVYYNLIYIFMVD